MVPLTSPQDQGKAIIIGPVETILPNDRKPWAWPDGTMGVLRSGNLYHFFGAADGSPKRAIGTLDNPLAHGVVDSKIGHLKNEYHYAAGGPVYRDPLSGTLLMFYHAERFIFPPGYLPYYSELGLARSMDGGQTWVDVGPIITPHVGFSSPYFYAMRKSFDVGWGGYVVVGDYFYIYFLDLLQDGKDYTKVNLAVARARVLDVVKAAVQRGTVVGWTKYYNGDWTEPGIGGRSSPLNQQDPSLWWGDVSYNSYLHKYIAVLIGGPGPGRDLFWLESKDGLHWTNYQKIVDDPGTDFYPTIVGLGDNPHETGQQFYIYYIRSQIGAKGGDRNLDAILVRRLITLSADSIKAQ